ncbi:MAG: efflux RND transporter periplasmic adaptor subunit [Akkermansiaceae bacterium]|jgi:RND family efflux transporter MFP subunit|nr:efflux RND transporter periplasmic adaptor subunit [Akkermansiaceae bacterium]
MQAPVFIPLLLAALFLPACKPRQAQGGPPPPPVVDFVLPVTQTITSWDEYNGRFEAVESVEVRARVSGLLEEIHFKDGQTVEKGDLLFTLDRRPFEAALKAAEAELNQTRAAAELARSNYERARQLLEKNAVAAEEVDVRKGTLAEADARVEAAKARVETANLDLSYTEIRSPIHGRIADRFISVGNLISGGSAESTLLTTIVSIDPIYCRIDADEATVLKYLRLQQQENPESARSNPVPVEVAVDGDTGYPRKGVIDFVSNAFDPATATLRARAVLENKDNFLAPGMFAKLRLPGRGEYSATLVPEIAIQSQQDLTFVLTLDENNLIQALPVTLGPRHEDLRVIESEIPANTRILVSGLTIARPGMPAVPKPAATAR